jgi:PAS domain S-box-containing protein
MQLPALRLPSRWFARPLIRTVAVPLTLLAATGLLAVALSQLGGRSGQLINSLDQDKTRLVATAVFIVFVFAGAALALAWLEASRRRKATGEKVQLQRNLEELRESEDRWRAVFENNPTSYFMVDAAGNIVSVNSFGAAQFGYTVHELIGHPVLSIFHGADRDAARTRLADCFEQLGRTMSWEFRKLRKDGTILVVRESVRAVLIKDRPVALIVCEDITDRKRAEYLAEQVFERSPDRISIVGRDYRYQRVNPAFELKWGLPAETVVGLHVSTFMGMENFEQTAKPYLDRCFAGEEVSYGAWFPTASHGRRYWALTHSPLRPESEWVEAAIVIIRDVTDHMLASEALREAQMDLAHVNRVTTMGQLAASIAHEVNQPLAGVIANAEACLRWLNRDTPDLDAARRSVEWIVEDGNRASEVIRGVRALANKTDIEKRPLYVNDVIKEVIVLVQRELMSHQVSLQMELAPTLPTVLGDRVQLQQVIINLVMNGIEAMHSVTDRPRELIIQSHQDETEQVLVSVTDCGVGISAEDPERLFDAFFTTKSTGLGMGLSICRSIMEAHGGRLWATANLPHGATFLFTLPVSQKGQVEPSRGRR